MIVSVVFTDMPLGTTDEGVNTHCDSAGSPVQEKVTILVNPAAALTVSVKVALLPAFTVALVGDALITKVSMMTSETASEVELVKLMSPL